MKTKNDMSLVNEASEDGITVRWVRQNETHDIFYVYGKGIDEYTQLLRSSQHDAESVLATYTA